MSLFQTAGLMCADPGNAHRDLSPAEIKAAGYSFMSPQGTNGTEKNETAGTLFNSSVTMAKYRDMVREKGLKFAPWSKLYGGDVVSQARAAAEMIHDLKPDGWIPNPETEFKEEPSLNRKYVDALKQRLAELGVALDSLEWCVCPLGGAAIPSGQEVSPWVFNYDMLPWAELPAAVNAPEAYWAPKDDVDGASPAYRPLNCAVQWIEKKLWPRERLAFTFGWWNESFPTPEQYFVDVDKARARYPGLSKGFMLYLADQASPDIIKRFGAGTAKGYAYTTVPATQVNPAEVRAAIVKLADSWLAQQTTPQLKSRLRVVRRIAARENVDGLWTKADDDVVAALNAAGIPS